MPLDAFSAGMCRPICSGGSLEGVRQKNLENDFRDALGGASSVLWIDQKKGVTAIGRATAMTRLRNRVETSFSRLRFRVDSPVQSYAILFPS